MVMALTDEEKDLSPSSLIVRNLPEDIFVDDAIKTDLEEIFRSFGESFFTFLPGFQRVIVKYVEGVDAASAKDSLHETEFKGSVLKVFFKEQAKKLGEPFLQLPKADRLFLISPPASPPVGWEQIIEDAPVVNYELISAVAKLEKPGKPVEIVSKTDSTPGIIVIGCEDFDYGDKDTKSIGSLPREDVQTKRPPVK